LQRKNPETGQWEEVGEPPIAKVTLIMDGYHCDNHNLYHVGISPECMKGLQHELALVNCELRVERDRLPGRVEADELHRMEEVLRAVHEVQGMKFHEGCNWVDAVESLVAKYAALK